MKDTAIMVQAMLKSAGFEATVNVMEFAAQMDRYYKGSFQLSIFNSVQYLDPVFSFDRYIGGPSASGDKVWRTPTANALLGRLFAASDSTTRQAAFDDLHRQYLEDVPAAIWANRSTISGVSPKVRGFAPWSGGKPRFWNVSLTP
jgi:peptide/nickel transport system substrate-binding protein